MKIGHEARLAGGIRVGRWLAVVTLLMLGAAFLLTVPLPNAMRARAITDFEDKLPLFASQTAELVHAARVDHVLAADAVLLQFASPESDYELLELRGQIASIEQALDQLQLRSALDPTTAYLIPTMSEELQQLQARQRVLQREIQALTHTAPSNGYLMGADRELTRPLASPVDDRQPGDPLAPELLGSTCERGALVGWFSPKQRLIVTAIVAQDDVKRLGVGQTALIGWDTDPQCVRRGIISRIAPEPIDQLPKGLIGDGALLSEPAAGGNFLPAQPHYEVTIEVAGQAHSVSRKDSPGVAGGEIDTLPASHGDLPPLRGSLATVQFELPRQTIWQRAAEPIRKSLKPF